MATRNAQPVKAEKRSGRPFLAKFTNRAAEAGLTAPSVYGGVEAKSYIVETNGAGVALVDVDGDRLLDVFLVNGARLDEQTPEAVNRLYRNRGDGRFEDVTAASGVGRAGWGGGVCAGDYDNDGDVDLYVAYWGLNSLYRNDGGGVFEDVAANAGATGPAEEWSSGCTFLDYDRDGFADLFVTQYQEFDLKTAAPSADRANCRWRGMPVFCGPRGLPYGGVTLYRNLGDGRFEDVTARSGVGDVRGFYAFTAVATDLTGDGWVDLYVACDSTPNLFFINNGDGTFTDFATETGVAFNEHGFEQGGMGVGVGDYNRDGLLDLVKTNFAGDYPNLYENQGEGIFEDVVIRTGLAVNPQFVGWGVELVDLDNDGFDDVFQVNGHVYPELDNQKALGETFVQANVVYRNLDGKRFEDVTDLAGPAPAERRSSRGAAFGDLDNDGDVDAVVWNMNAPPSLLVNELTGGGGWLRVALEGTKSNRSALGAIVTLRAGDFTQSEAVLSQSSFLSHNDLRLHFGLGVLERADSIEVQWPSGDREMFPGVAVNREVLLVEGSGKTEVRE